MKAALLFCIFININIEIDISQVGGGIECVKEESDIDQKEGV